MYCNSLLLFTWSGDGFFSEFHPIYFFKVSLVAFFDFCPNGMPKKTILFSELGGSVFYGSYTVCYVYGSVS